MKLPCTHEPNLLYYMQVAKNTCQTFELISQLLSELVNLQSTIEYTKFDSAKTGCL